MSQLDEAREKLERYVAYPSQENAYRIVEAMAILLLSVEEQLKVHKHTYTGTSVNHALGVVDLHGRKTSEPIHD